MTMSPQERARTPYIDYLQPLIADGDTGFGGTTATVKLRNGHKLLTGRSDNYNDFVGLLDKLSRPRYFCKANGALIRHILQQLESHHIIEIVLTVEKQIYKDFSDAKDDGSCKETLIRQVPAPGAYIDTLGVSLNIEHEIFLMLKMTEVNFCPICSEFTQPKEDENEDEDNLGKGTKFMHLLFVADKHGKHFATASACEINAQEQELGQQQEIEFTCEICIEPTPTTRKFNNNNLCTHLFCVDCIAKYIEVKILENTAQISCPGLNCRHNIDPISSNTMSLISKPQFSKWCELLCQDSVLALQKSYCPNRECMVIVVNECTNNINNIVKKSKCPNCKEFECKKEWHAGFRCEDNEELTRDRNLILLGMLIESEKWQRCLTCGHCVQRSEGCRIMISGGFTAPTSPGFTAPGADDNNLPISFWVGCLVIILVLLTPFIVIYFLTL
ncbi:hypothetical protein ACFE04_022172 [Oxalis oulophora]